MGWNFARTNSVACSTTMGGGEDSLLFCYMRVALGNGRTDAASVVCYVRRTPSELPSARDGQPADRHTYMDLGLAGMVLPEERERDIPYICTSEHVARSNHSFTAKTPLPRLNVASSKLFFFVSLSSYRILSFVWRWEGTNRREDQERNI